MCEESNTKTYLYSKVFRRKSLETLEDPSMSEVKDYTCQNVNAG